MKFVGFHRGGEAALGSTARPRCQESSQSPNLGVSGQCTTWFERRSPHAARMDPPSYIACLISGACAPSAVHSVEIPGGTVVPKLGIPSKQPRCSFWALLTAAASLHLSRHLCERHVSARSSLFSRRPLLRVQIATSGANGLRLLMVLTVYPSTTLHHRRPLLLGFPATDRRVE